MRFHLPLRYFKPRRYPTRCTSGRLRWSDSPEEISACRNKKAESGPFAEMYAAKPAPAAVAERINWYCEVISGRKLENSLRDALNASALEKSTRTSAASCGCSDSKQAGITNAHFIVALLLCTHEASKAKTGENSLADALGERRREARSYRTPLCHRHNPR